MIRFVCLILALAVGAWAETCDFAAFHQCVKDGGAPGKQGGKNETKWAEQKAKFEKCFKDASCKVPQPKEADKSKFEAARKCKSQVLSKVKSDIQQCVQKTNKDFKFPERKEGDHKEGGRRHWHEQRSGEKQHENPFFAKIINESCPTDQAKSSVKACLQALRPAKSSSSNVKRPDSKERKQKFCQKISACEQKLSPTCQKQFNDTKQALCKCAKDIITPQAAQIEANLKACWPQSNNKDHQSQRSTRKPRIPGENLINKFCQSCNN